MILYNIMSQLTEPIFKTGTTGFIQNLERKTLVNLTPLYVMTMDGIKFRPVIHPAPETQKEEKINKGTTFLEWLASCQNV